MSSRKLIHLALSGLVATTAVPLMAQNGAFSNRVSANSSAVLEAKPDSLLVRSLVFRSIGPATMSGRIVDVAVPEIKTGGRATRLGSTMYVAVATGGIWKTVNAGVSWTPITDSIGVGSVGAVAVAPSNTDVVWVGSGEPQNMRSSSWGIGVFKSTDGGKTWSKPMLPKSQHIGRIVIDPRDANVVYVAAVGPLWAPGGERGLFKTTDGGATWKSMIPSSQYTGATEIVMDPKNPDVIYAASLERERRAYGFLPGGTETAIYKTTNAGATWNKLAGGLPTGELGRIGLAVCASQTNTVYATVHAKGEGNGFYRSDDAGMTWKRVNNSNGTAWYYSQVRCDPKDPEHVVRLNANAQESRDGGKTWTPYAAAGGVHGDHHALWFNPDFPEHQVLGNDGGLDVTYDGGRTWQDFENIVGAQFYAISVDDAKPYYNVYGGLQDNQTWGGPSRTRNAFGPTNADWWRMAGGDGFYNVPDKFDHNMVYAESQEGGLVRHDSRLGQNKSIRPIPKPGERHRYNWSAPIVPSHFKAGTVYFGANVLFKSTDFGDTWQTISPDLTRNLNRDVLPMRGAIPAKDALGLNEGTALPSNISTLDESPKVPGLLAVGTDDGVVQVTRDDGKTWTKSMTFPGVPDTTYVSRVILSAHNPGTVYATFDGHRSNDFKPYVLKSTDYGRTWTSITANLPEGSVQVIREHHREPNLLFVGTEFGVFFTVDGGKSWTPLKSGMPGVPVWDLAIQQSWNDLVVGTHGRGIYILDNISPLEKLAEAKRAPVAYLFPIRNEINLQPNGSRNSGMGSVGFSGQNPENGVLIAYQFNDIAPTAKATLEIADALGTVVRVLPVTKQSGLFRTVWDMRVGAPLTGPVDTSAVAGGGGRGGRGGGGGGGGGFGGGFGGGASAPAQFQAMPGSYTARLRVTPASGAPVVLEQRFALTKDPLVALTDLQLKALYDYRLGVARFQRTLAQGGSSIDSVFNRFQAVRKTLAADSSKATPAVKSQVAAIEKSFADITKDWGQTPAQRIAAAQARQGRPPDEEDSGAPPQSEALQDRAGRLGSVMGVSFMPSGWQSEMLRTLPTEATAVLARLRTVEQQVAALEKSVGK